MELANYPSILLTRLCCKCVSLIFVCSIFAQAAHAQLIVPGILIEDLYPTFNTRSIAQAEIKTVVIRLLRKPSSKSIFDDGRRIQYEFDTQGRLKEFQKISRGKFGKNDTSKVQYTYENDLLESKTEVLGNYRKRIVFQSINDTAHYERIYIKRAASGWTLLTEDLVRTSQFSQGGCNSTVAQKGAVGSQPYEKTIFRKCNSTETKEIWLGNRMLQYETWQSKPNTFLTYEKVHHLNKQNIVITYSDQLLNEGSRCVNGRCQNWSFVFDENRLPKGFLLIDPTTQDMEIWEFRITYH